MTSLRRRKPLRAPDSPAERPAGCLEGQLLIAMPAMTDKRFRRSVIFMCAHSDEGAMGLIINQRASGVSLPELLGQLDIVSDGAVEDLPQSLLAMDVQVGGPVERGRGFVLHTADYSAAASTLRIIGGICLTATVDILRALAEGNGPERAMLALGYAGWSPGQLESEIQANGWLHGPADADILFSRDHDLKYDRALSKLGVDLQHLVSEAGHA